MNTANPSPEQLAPVLQSLGLPPLPGELAETPAHDQLPPLPETMDNSHVPQRSAAFTTSPHGKFGYHTPTRTSSQPSPRAYKDVMQSAVEILPSVGHGNRAVEKLQSGGPKVLKFTVTKLSRQSKSYGADLLARSEHTIRDILKLYSGAEIDALLQSCGPAEREFLLASLAS